MRYYLTYADCLVPIEDFTYFVTLKPLFGLKLLFFIYKPLLCSTATFAAPVESSDSYYKLRKKSCINKLLLEQSN